MDLLDSGDFSKLVARIVTAPGYKAPTLPVVVTKLLRLANDPGADFSSVEEVVSADAGIAARVVAAANSALNSRGSKIESIRTAISKLGLLQLRDLAFRAAVEAKIFRVAEYMRLMEDERRHAVAVGLLSQEVCRATGLDPEQAFLCGLLHDIGKPIAFSIAAETSRQVGRVPPPDDIVVESVDQVHAQVGELMCTQWEVPRLVVDAVAHHHAPLHDGRLDQLAAVVAVADRCALHAGAGRRARPVNPIGEKVFFDLNLSQESVTVLLDKAEAIAAEC